MLSVHPFGIMDVHHISESESLLRPDDVRFEPLVYQTTDMAVVRDLLTDPQLVPKGVVQDEGGTLRAVFWQLRPGH